MAFQCAFRISDPLIRQWVIDSLYHVSPSMQYESPNPQLMLYDSNYRHEIPRDLANGTLDKATIVLCLDEECHDSYLSLFGLNVRHIIYPASPFASEALQLAACSAGKVLNRPFPPPAEIVMSQVFTIQTSNDYETVPGQIHQALDELGFGSSTRNAALALQEGLTNAVFHSFREPGCHARKYAPESFLGLYDKDRVEISLTVTKQWLRISITDNCGSLGPLSVANSMDRHRASLGLNDTRGRGFYLMQNLSHRMIVTIQRGINTAVELYFLKQDPGAFCRHFELVEV